MLPLAALMLGTAHVQLLAHGRVHELATVDALRRTAEEEEREVLEEAQARFANHPGTGHPLSGVRLTVRGSAPNSKFWKWAGQPEFYNLFLFDERDVIELAVELRPWIEARRDVYGDLRAPAGAGGRPTKLDFVDRTLLMLYLGTKDAPLCAAALLFEVSQGTVWRDMVHLLGAFHDCLLTEVAWPDHMAQNVAYRAACVSGRTLWGGRSSSDRCTSTRWTTCSFSSTAPCRQWREGRRWKSARSSGGTSWAARRGTCSSCSAWPASSSSSRTRRPRAVPTISACTKRPGGTW